jgi:phage gpG-like protein
MAGAAQALDLSQLPGWAEAQAARQAGLDMTPAWKKCKLILVRVTKENFTGQHAPDGTPWLQTRGLRARGNAGGKILSDRRILMGSLTANGPGHIERESSDTLIWGTNVEHAATHQYGDPDRRPKKAKALAIPLTPEAYRAGSPRNFPRPLLLIWKRGESTGILVDRTQAQKRAAKKALGKSVKDLKVHYLLVAKAVIPARPFVGVNAEIADGCGAVLLEHAAGGR